jgi:hypothetical protein
MELLLGIVLFGVLVITLRLASGSKDVLDNPPDTGDDGHDANDFDPPDWD